MKLLEGKVAIITGGSRGIGKMIAIRYAQQGANVAFSDLVVDENAKAVEEELKSFGVQAKAYASDASNYEGSQVFVDEVV